MKNKKVIVIIIFVLVVLVVIAITSTLFSTEDMSYKQSNYQQVMAVDLDDQYPSSPSRIMEVFMETQVCLFGGAPISEDEKSQVISQQWKLLSQEFKDLNSLEVYATAVDTLMAERSRTNNYILDYTLQLPEYFEDSMNTCWIDVMEYNSNMVNRSLRYYLVNTDGKWQITMWELAPPTEDDEQ